MKKNYYDTTPLRRNYIFSNPMVIAIVVFLLSTAFATWIIWQMELDRIKIARVHAFEIASGYADAIIHANESNFATAYVLAALVKQGNGVVPHFHDVASQMLLLYPGIDSLQLAPGGVVQFIEPLAGNEKAIGHDLMKDEMRSAEANLARDTGQLTFAGPFKMIQGSFGGVGRLPVFLNDEMGDSYFWGFVNVVLRFPEILESANLSQLEMQGFAYELWRIHPDTKQKEIIIASKAILTGEPVERMVNLSNATWILSIAPINGWSVPYGLFLKMMQGMIFSLLVAWLAKLIIDLKRHKAELECLAFFDTLTGLPNRRLLYDRLNQAMAWSKRDEKILAICYLDLDNFKLVNDTLGHESGDCLLIEVTKRFRSCLREQDTLARIGGDEFVLLLQNLEETNQYKVVLERILKAAADPIALSDKNVMASISIGVTLYPQDDNDPATLLQHADEAMYQAKRDGKGKICLFEKASAAFKKC
ncbi:diguanylate cyclase (GGDEF) domain-containing protein [Pelosinus propionicus DSM 13327]|uniref:Diguanylate cyclase (GGDEF) domain-containing protein n=2 Tax=Pelosinus TaxID=365348 RepID=A0A1I4I341_9FIRM|nr:diguanylate cyclase (GGDEF) domain-containing protein [Pelosinus propionicus DSM 13327]